jgi:hypothetical protein
MIKHYKYMNKALPQKKFLCCYDKFKTGGRLTENQLIKIVFFSVDQNFHNQLTEILDAFQLIKKFHQLPKKNWRILAVDWNFNNGILSF